MAENISNLGLMPDSVGDLNGLFSGFVSKLLIALIILFIGFVIGRLVGRLISRVLHEFELNKVLKKTTTMGLKLEEIISKLVTYLIYFLAIIWALETLSLAPVILYIISGAVLIIIILSILLSIKDFVPNFIAGLTIQKKRSLKPGDHIKVKDMEGEVVKVNMVEVSINNKHGDVIYIPNSMLLKSEFVKFKK
tara:strand:+ start:529 stop:1107 length:579 start_codon:yes stop_codon:yes gene_type:complete